MNSKEAREYGNLTTPYWRMRITKEVIEFYHPQMLIKYHEITDKPLLWELIKMELRANTIRYSKEKRSKLRKEEKDLRKELQELDRQNL